MNKYEISEKCNVSYDSILNTKISIVKLSNNRYFKNKIKAILKELNELGIIKYVYMFKCEENLHFSIDPLEQIVLINVYLNILNDSSVVQETITRYTIDLLKLESI